MFIKNKKNISSVYDKKDCISSSYTFDVSGFESIWSLSQYVIDIIWYMIDIVNFNNI